MRAIVNQKYIPEFRSAPSYYSIIKQPIDLTTIAKNISENRYHRIDEFIDDMNLIFQNCSTYNKVLFFLYTFYIYMCTNLLIVIILAQAFCRESRNDHLQVLRHGRTQISATI